MKHATWLLAAVLCCGTAVADDGNAWYGKLELGFVKPLPKTGSVRTAPPNPTLTYFGVEYGNGVLLGGAVGYGMGSSSVELELNSFKNDIEDPAATTLGADSQKYLSAMANAWYGLGEWWSIKPYIGGGLGYAKKDMNGASDTGVVAQGGIGAGWNFTPNWMLDVGARYVRSDEIQFERGTSDYSAGFTAWTFVAGVRYNFLAAAPVPPPPAPVTVAAPLPQCKDTVDNDSDSVIDFPGDPGCSAEDDDDETDAPPPEPEAPAPEPMVSTPEPEPTIEAATTGDTIVLHGVTFETAKAVLTSDARTILDDVAGQLSKRPELNVEVGGHTDSKGSDQYNQTLSQARADSVRQYLIDAGIDAGRLTAVGYGESTPVADNETGEGRAQNRRVELKIL